jgi:Pyruvate/2-oxoacid:ferredoxin oxidoreductase gamma subunit
MMIVDSTLQPGKPTRKDVGYYFIPATQVATDLGNKLGANFVLLGAYIRKTRAVALEDVERYLDIRMEGEKRKTVRELNKAALRQGAKLMEDYRA